MRLVEKNPYQHQRQKSEAVTVFEPSHQYAKELGLDHRRTTELNHRYVTGSNRRFVVELDHRRVLEIDRRSLKR